MCKVAYPDLMDAEFVFEALLGHGMFADKLPPCFTSEDLFEYTRTHNFSNGSNPHAYIEYQATRNTNIPRQLAIPHPESYWKLCHYIKENWQLLNEHIGRPHKFNFCHVRKIEGKKHIFEMNYNGSEKWSQEELLLDYSLGCKYIASADISTFFPSVYAHSIPWALKGKEWAKQHRCTSFKKKKNKGENCKSNNYQPCPHQQNELWPNDLDSISCSIKDGETNGLLIGPHTSNIISEIILTQVDFALQKAGFLKVIRYIDDYTFFAKDENEANDFLRTLVLELKKYELVLNAKKTKITPFKDFNASSWVSQLNQFSFPDHDPIGFTSINSFVDYAQFLSKENNDFASLNYAVKVLSKKNLSDRAKRLYIKKMIQIAVDYPYFLPLLEDYVFLFSENEVEFLKEFLPHLLDRSLQNGSTDSLAFVFYFGIRYEIAIEPVDWDKVIVFDDCVSILLAYKYCEINSLPLDLFKDKANEILKLPMRDQDKFWLFLYEFPYTQNLTPFLKKLKKEKVCFLKNLTFLKSSEDTIFDSNN